MSKYIHSDFILLEANLQNEEKRSLWESFKGIFSSTKELAVKTIKGMKLDQIGLAILNMLRSVPLLGRLIPNQKDREKQVKAIVGTISIGNGVTKCMTLLQWMTKTVWTIMPLPTSTKNNFLLPIFDYNDRKSFMQTLYKLMLDAEIEPRHANAYLIVLTLKIPIYNMLFVFKSLWSRSKVNKTKDDELHPWTSGDPNTNPETGLNETEQRLQKKVQKFIQIKKLAIANETDNSLDLNSKLNKEIIKEAIIGLIVPLFLPFLNFFKICFGVSDDNPFHQYVDPAIKWLIIGYYCYFLVTAMVLTSLAIENEEAFHPSKSKTDNSNKNLSDDGSIDFHQS